MMPRTPSSTLLPYTTLFRSLGKGYCHIVAAGQPLRMRDDTKITTRTPCSLVRLKLLLAADVPAQGPHPSLGCVRIVSLDRKSTRLNSSHRCISYAVFCLKKK